MRKLWLYAMAAAVAAGAGAVFLTERPLTVTVTVTVVPTETDVEPFNALVLTGIILAVCLVASGLGVRAALKVDPATALGG